MYKLGWTWYKPYIHALWLGLHLLLSQSDNMLGGRLGLGHQEPSFMAAFVGLLYASIQAKMRDHGKAIKVGATRVDRVRKALKV